jgi:hypothetical protein
MVCIKSDSDLPSSPKFLDLVSRLKVGERDVFWNLHHLWYWVSPNYPDGVMKNISDFAIAHSAKWQGDPKVFVDALVCSGFIDREEGALVMHDWSTWRSESVRAKVRRATDKRPENDQKMTSSAQVVSKSLLVFPVSGNDKDWLLSEAFLEEQRPLYPGVDVLLECKKALQWVKANPTRKKTSRGMPKFLIGWLERSQNKSRGIEHGQSGFNGNGYGSTTKQSVAGKYTDLSN